MRPAMPHELAQEIRPAGVREPGGSPWLGLCSPTTPVFAEFQNLERAVKAAFPPLVSAVSPAAGMGAFADWLTHLAWSPAKQAELAVLAAAHAWRWWLGAVDTSRAAQCSVEPLPQDRRFDDPAWSEPPFSWRAQAFLLGQDWWHCATTAVPGVSRHHEQMLQFAARQWLDMLSPSNSLANPEVLRQTCAEGGLNLLRGAMNAAGDAWRELAELPPAGAEQFKPGINVAVTPGRVVLRNRLMELIQYTPSTSTVHPEPVLIVPAWIMKYYVLDLEPHNSMVKFLVDAGHSVFAISWKNPGADDRDLGMDDYDGLGVRAALDAIEAALPGRGVHAIGYCLGGTLLAITAAALGRQYSKRLKTLSLLAAQTDFTEPGELSLFIDESQLAWLDGLMAQRGYLDKRQMAASFQMLRSRDLVWSYRLGAYLKGQRAPLNALMAWNADGTRLPERMHSEYLRSIYLDNALARGEYRLSGEPINLADIRQPTFLVGTVQDHVAPWRSVFKLHQFSDAEKTFVLTAGGHNKGIVNPPGDARSSYRLRRWKPGERLLTPDEWLAATEPRQGSWWTPWLAWLGRHSSARVTPPEPLPALAPAPGTYVLEP
jgi:polyhydroxyalkanoate synthase